MRIAIGSRIRIAHSGLSPDNKIVKIMRQLAIEFLEAKKPLAVDSRPITANAIEARPMKGDRKALSRVVFQAKKGKKAVWILVRNWVKEKSGVSRSSAMMDGLMKAAITRAVSPTIMMKIVRIRGKVGKVLIVKRKCGCKRAKRAMKIARYMR